MESPERERRKRPRVRAGLAARFSDASGDGLRTLETRNLSTAGVCCRTQTPLPPLTKVQITLVVPNPTSKKRDRACLVETEAIVVRSEPVLNDKGEQEYEVACAFTLLGEQERRVLEAFVDRRLAETGPAVNPTEWQGAGPAVRD